MALYRKREEILRHLKEKERQRLEALHRYEVLDSEPELAFDRIAALVSKVFAVPVVLIGLIDHDRQWFKACYGYEVREMGLEASFCTHTIQSGAVMVVPDTLQARPCRP